MNLSEGVLILDNTTLDKPYAEKVEYLTYHWSGKYHDVVKGINLITLLWSDGRALVPIDFRLYNPSRTAWQRTTAHAQKDKLFRPSCPL